jgi:hypothetical protein
MANHKTRLAVCGAVIVAAALSVGLSAISNPHKMAYLTFSQPVRLPGVSLPAGTYVFEVANPGTTADVVRVLSRDRSAQYFMGFTRGIARPHDLPRRQMVSLGEAAAGTAPAVTTWWPENDSTGRQFVYREPR